MDQFLNSLASHLELLVLGILFYCTACLGVCYRLTLFEALGYAVKAVIQFIASSEPRPHFSNGGVLAEPVEAKKTVETADALLKYFRAGLVLVMAFYCGSVMNSITYWVMAPAHFRVELAAAEITGNLKHQSYGIDQLTELHSSFLLSPMPGFRKVLIAGHIAHLIYFEEKAKWAHDNFEWFKYEYAGSLQTARLVRGTAVRALALILAILIRIVYRVTLLAASWRSLSRWKSAAVELCLLGGAVILYIVSMAAYWTFEIEFHIGFLISAKIACAV